jgi:hypothetical protein
MTNRLEHALVDAVQALVAQGRPVNLAERALRQSRRMRWRRRALVGVAAVAAVAALAVPYAVLNRPAGVDVAGPAGGAPIALADGWIVGGYTTAATGKQAGKAYVYDRAAMQYRALPYRFAVPAPTGSLVAVWDDGRVGIVDLASTAPVRWVTFQGQSREVSGLAPRPWSPDGTRLLVTLGDDPSAVDNGSSPDTPIVIVDAATATARTLPHRVQCGDGCQPVWLPGDRVGMNKRSGPGVTAFSAADGAPAGTVQLPGYVFGYPWSPDGTHVVLAVPAGSTGPLPLAVIDASTGRTVSQPPIQPGSTVYWTTDDRMLLVTEDGGITLLSIGGNVLGSYPRPAQLTGWSELTLIRG